MTAELPFILEDLAQERRNQDNKFGVQRHPDGTSVLWNTWADMYRESCDRAFKSGQGTWLHILLEEVYEAAAESDRAKLRKELVQVAAVCVAWIEDIDA